MYIYLGMSENYVNGTKFPVTKILFEQIALNVKSILKKTEIIGIFMSAIQLIKSFYFSRIKLLC